jgi:hypothetical protein
MEICWLASVQLPLDVLCEQIGRLNYKLSWYIPVFELYIGLVYYRSGPMHIVLSRTWSV